MSPTVEHLVGLAKGCGAADVGGALTRSEAALLQYASKASPKDVRAARSAIREGEDPLGEIMCQVRSPLERRPLGAFYTAPKIVQSMVRWALEQSPDRFVDPGCGSGRFSVAAKRAAPSIEVLAIDLDPLATLLTRAAMAAIGAKNVRVLHADYLSASVPKIAGTTAFVGNPPYVRHHDLSASTKAQAASLAMKVGHSVSGLAGLHALFYLVTLAKHSQKGDIGSFITSSEWLDVGYGSIIRKMFSNGLGGRSLMVFDAKSVPFEDAMTTAAITTFRIGHENQIARVAYASLYDSICLEETGHPVLRSVLERATRWSPLLHDFDEALHGATVGSLFRVSRGQVTGSNKYFVMTRADARARHIEKFCVPLVTSAEEVFSSNGVLRNHEQRMVGLSVPRDFELSRNRHLANYIRGGEAAGVHRGYVASHRSPWYSVRFPAPPIVATYMARQAPYFALNPDGLGLLNIAHGLHPREPLSDATLRSIVSRMNETRSSFVGRGRTYHGGLEKFEPGEMEALPLPVIAR